MHRYLLSSLLLLASAAPVSAAVQEATPTGFTLRNQARVAATPAQTWAMLGRPGEWWNKAHTYSGDAANLRLELKAGGCFCETLPARAAGPAGGVEHGRVLTAMPFDMLVLDAALGPLQSQAMVGRLIWSLRPLDGGTEITQTFVAGGYAKGGVDKLAPIVDTVLAEQLEGLRRRLAR